MPKSNTKTTAKTNLTDTQLVILNAAAQRDGGSALPLPPSLTLGPGPAASVLKGLVGKGLLQPTPATGDLPVWKEDGDRRDALVITEAGLAALGIDDAAEGDTVEPSNPPGETEPEQPPAAPTGTDPGTATNGADAEPAAKAAPRPGSKLARLIEMVGQTGGVSLAAIMAETGWQAHTARAALTGLRKRGLTIERGSSAAGETVYRRTDG